MSTTPGMETPIEPRREAGRGLPGFPATPLPADRFGRRFRVGMAALLLAMLVLYWAMWRWEDTAWFAKEDGIVEYATAALLAVGALACVLAGRLSRRMGHRNLGLFHYLVAIAFAVGALEEISWGQRIFGWETPGAISDVNRQGETTLHNISWLETPVYTGVAWMSILAIAGAAVRVVLHLGRRVTTADLILPAAVTVPLLAINLLMDVRRAARRPPRAPLPRRRIGVRRLRVGARRGAVRVRGLAPCRRSAPRAAASAPYHDVSRTSDAISSPTSSSVRPTISRSTCSLCWPTVGAAHANRPGVRDSVNCTRS